MSTLTLTPFDTLFLRDGRAFSPGDGTEAFGTFPPLPQAIQGLVRSRLLADHCGRWETFAGGCRDRKGQPCDLESTCRVQPVVGRIANQGALETRGPWLVAGDQPLLPIPTDVIASAEEMKVLAGDNSEGSVQTGLLAPVAGRPSSNMPGELEALQPPPELARSDFGIVEGWMSWDAYSQYLVGHAPKLTLRKNWWRSGDLWTSERRPGLAMQPGRNRALDKHLFFSQHTRMQKFAALGIEVLHADGLLSSGQNLACLLGGERRSVGVCASTGVPWHTMAAGLAEACAGTRRVKVVVLQPAWFKAGWHPLTWSPSTGRADATTSTGPVTGAWRAALVGRPEQIGGWDLARREPKPLRAFVPRGSIFYLEFAAGADAAACASAFWNNCVSDTPPGENPSYPSIGLGHVLSGTWISKE